MPMKKQMKKPSKKLVDAVQRVLNLLVKQGIVKRHRRIEADRPKGKRGPAPYMYSLVKK